MQKLNKSDTLIHKMSRLGCFDAEYADSPICKKLLGLLRTKNESFHDHDYAQAMEDYSTLNRVTIISYALSILLNCTLLWMLYKDPLKRLRTPSSLLIGNLGISDLLGACFSLAIETQIFQDAKYKPNSSTTLFLPWLVATTAQSSYYTVVMVSLERYAAISHPFRYRVLVVTRHVLFLMIITWLLAFAISTPLFFTTELRNTTNTGNKIYAIHTFTLIVVILVLYPLTHSSLKSQRKHVLTMNTSNQKLRMKKLKIEKQFANTMFLVWVTLIVFTSPYVVVFFFTTTNCYSCILNNHFLHVWMYFRIFFAIHFGVNPVIYAWRLPCYRKSLLVSLSFTKYRSATRKNQGMPSISVKRSGIHRNSGHSIQMDTRT